MALTRNLIKAKQIDMADLGPVLLTFIKNNPTLLQQFNNLVNAANTFTTTPALGPVINISVSTITDTTATVAWAAMSGAVSYDLEYRIQGDDLTLGIIKAINTTSYSLTGLLQATTYAVAVRANFS